MAIAINNRRWVSDQGKQKEVIDYFVDTAADIANLPDATHIGTTSTALILETSDVFVLTETGWVSL
ncbi:hypothetical protein FACS189468_9480 [Spirochaetia bacterium]|nr:hypothetical protein FACS189468_9480 [Spirochaetia bacterium]